MIKLILPNIALQSPEISDSSADLLLVERNQRIYLDNMLYTNNDKNVILSGNAGTGKPSFLKELIKSIKKIKVFCSYVFQKLLLNDISLFSESNNNVTCFRYYDLAKLLIQKAQLKINTNGISEEKIFKEIFPEKMQEAIINLIDKNLQTFDWILVDEAQDLFSKPIIDSLSMLKNKNLGKLILGLDVGLQSEVFKNFDKAYYDEVIKDSEVIKLYSNFRNPKNIAMKAVEVCGINNIEDFKRAFFHQLDLNY